MHTLAPPREKLEDNDLKFWTPIHFIVEYIEKQIPKKGLVLEVGSGINYFKRADMFIDMIHTVGVSKEKMIHCDIQKEKLPFQDKKFDFVYCRHVLEDLYNPFLVLNEMSRVAKAGYISTPSPVSEMCKGIDVGSPSWRGYNHHRFFIWEDNGGLCLLSKFPIIEHFGGVDDEKVVNALTGVPNHWDTHFFWKNKIKYRHLQDDLNFKMPADYPLAVREAMNSSSKSNTAFYESLIKAQEK